MVGSRRRVLERNFCAFLGEVRTVLEFIHLEAVHVGNLSGCVVIILVAELLVVFQQVVHVIRAEYQPAACCGNLQGIQLAFQSDDVFAGTFLTSVVIFT